MVREAPSYYLEAGGRSPRHSCPDDKSLSESAHSPLQDARWACCTDPLVDGRPVVGGRPSTWPEPCSYASLLSERAVLGSLPLPAAAGGSWFGLRPMTAARFE